MFLSEPDLPADLAATTGNPAAASFSLEDVAIDSIVHTPDKMTSDLCVNNKIISGRQIRTLYIFQLLILLASYPYFNKRVVLYLLIHVLSLIYCYCLLQVILLVFNILGSNIINIEYT